MSETKKDDLAIDLAKILLNQIERENDQCAFWIISATHKIKCANPQMSMTCLYKILTSEMPKTAKIYAEYIRNT